MANFSTFFKKFKILSHVVANKVSIEKLVLEVIKNYKKDNLNGDWLNTAQPSRPDLAPQFDKSEYVLIRGTH